MSQKYDFKLIKNVQEEELSEEIAELNSEGYVVRRVETIEPDEEPVEEEAQYPFNQSLNVPVLFDILAYKKQ